MIDPYIIGLWIGFLSFVFVFCTIMDMITVSKDVDIVVRKPKKPIENVSPSYTNDYDDVTMMIDED